MIPGGSRSRDSEPVPHFASRRERRLWGWTLAVVVAIYATLGLARTWAGMLRQRDLLDDTFLFSAFLIGAAVITLAVAARPGIAEVGVMLGVAAVYIMVFVRMALPEERTHVMEYGVVAILILAALRERTRSGRRVPVPALLAFAAATAVGVVDELIQLLIPARVFDPADMFVNAVSAALAVVGSVALRGARRWGQKRRRDRVSPQRRSA